LRLKKHYKDLRPPEEWLKATQRNLPSLFQEKKNGDLLAVPDSPSFAPETLMMYLGVNGTYTCAHFDLVGTLGHNLVLDSDEGPTSIWFIVRGSDHEVARQFWLQNGGCLEKDNCFLSWDIVGSAPFPVYVVLQGAGDFVLVPSDSAHQVFNKGRNVKISWNRFPPSCIETSYFRVLPRYREVGREETYRVVGLAYFGLLEWERRLRKALDSQSVSDIIAEAKSLGSLLAVVCDFVFNQRLNRDDPLWERVVVSDVNKVAEPSPLLQNPEPHTQSVPESQDEVGECENVEAAGQEAQELSPDLLDDGVVQARANEVVAVGEGARRKKKGARRFVSEEKDARKFTLRAVAIPELFSLPVELRSSVMTCDICMGDLFCRFVKCDLCEAENRSCDFCLKCVSEQRGCQSHKEKLRVCELMPLKEIETVLLSSYKLYGEAVARVLGSLARLTPLEDSFGARKRSDCTAAALMISGALRGRVVSCHACIRVYTDRDMLPCSQCSLVFCDQCFWNRHGDKLSTKLRCEKWVCYRCTLSCNCAKCREKMLFVSFLPYGSRCIQTMPSDLLPLHDRAAPTVQVEGIGATSFVYLAPLRVFPAPAEWVNVAFTTLLLARNKDGCMWPARRATSTEEDKAERWGRPEQILVRFQSVRTVAWLPFADVIVKPSAAELRKAERALDEANAKRFVVAVEALKQQAKNARQPRRRDAATKPNPEIAAKVEEKVIKSKKEAQNVDVVEEKIVDPKKDDADKKQRGRPKKREVEKSEKEESKVVKTVGTKRSKIDDKAEECDEEEADEDEDDMEEEDNVDEDVDYLWDENLKRDRSKKRSSGSQNRRREREVEDDIEDDVEPQAKTAHKKAAVKRSTSTPHRSVKFPASAFEAYCKEHRTIADTDLYVLAVSFVGEVSGRDSSWNKRLMKEQGNMARIRAMLSRTYDAVAEYYDARYGDWVLVEWEGTDAKKKWFRGQVVGSADGSLHVMYEDGQLITEDLLHKHCRLISAPCQSIDPPVQSKKR
jgi:hypothetical protein